MPELKTLGRNVKFLENVKRPLPRITYDEAVDILRKKGNYFEWGNDLGGADETVVSEQFDRPVMVHRYPAEIKAFYMKRDPQNPKLALAVDVLAPEGYGEIIGGSQREDDLDLLAGAAQGAQPPAGGVRMVPRPPPVRLRAACRFRARRRTDGLLDLRTGSRARDDSVPADDLPAHPIRILSRAS